jgi:DNA primase
VSDSIFEEIRDTLDLEFFMERESLAHKVSRGSSGMQINVKECPACGDRRYRVYLNADSGLGNCFVCNEPYNKLTFIKKYLGEESWKPVIDYCKEVMKDQGWRPKRMESAAVEMESPEVKLPYSEPLPIDGQNLVYLENRGITSQYAKYFGLRYCEFGWWDYFDEDGTAKKQRFDNRVIIPVYDLNGSLMTFQGRDLLPAQTAEEIEAAGGWERQKYLFPKMLPGTGRYLYNGHNVVLTTDVVMGEGAFDVAAIKIAFDEDVNLRNVVAVGSFGKHLSYGSKTGDDQLGRFLKLRRAGLETVTIMWDGEVKALISALDAAKILRGIGLKVRIALLPAEKDPNEVPAEVVRAAYYQAQTYTPMLDVKWRMQNPYRKKARCVR